MISETEKRFRLFSNLTPRITAAFSDRSFDTSRRGDFLRLLDLDPSKLFLVKQVHGESIVRVQPETTSTETMMADGLITDCAGITLGVLTADCVPVFFCDPVKGVIGLVHAGWRGALHGIAPKMVSAFQQNFGSQPADIRVGFGPCIRQSSYEVGEEFEAMFPGFFLPGADAGKGYLDLAGWIRQTLLLAGVQPGNVEDSGLCTFSEQDHFYSYRRENQTRERILSVISMRAAS